MEAELEGRLLDEAPFVITESEESGQVVRSRVWQMAWPSVLTMLLMTTNAILDRAFVGRLGSDALAAVGVGGQLFFLLVSISFAVTTGTTALVARFTGAEEPDEAGFATGQSIGLGILLGLFFTALAYLLLPVFVTAMRLSSSAADQCTRF